MVEKIVAMIESKGLTQAAVERAACLSENRISKWKDHRGEPKATDLWRIAKVLETPFEYFLDDAIDTPPPVAITDGERDVLRVVRRIGVDAAMDRLLQFVSAPVAATADVQASVGLPRDPRTGKVIKKEESAGRDVPARTKRGNLG